MERIPLKLKGAFGMMPLGKMFGRIQDWVFEGVPALIPGNQDLPAHSQVCAFVSEGLIVRSDLNPGLVVQPRKDLRILVLCDFHFLEDEDLDRIAALEYDVCLVLGDILFGALPRIRELVRKPIFAVGGNHDTRKMYEQVKIPYIHGQVVCVNGWTIAGIEGSHRYKNTSEVCMMTHEESLAVAEELPKADILISHDASYEKFGSAPNRVGLQGISRYIQKNGPILHLHGHHHLYDRYYIWDTLCLACYRAMLVGTDGSVEVVF